MVITLYYKTASATTTIITDSTTITATFGFVKITCLSPIYVMLGK